MAKAERIARKKGSISETSFEALKREGIAHAQLLSGEIWSDYNTHDPGVTILEQLCYALTDLIYRTDFPVADYLTETTGEIDFEKLALHAPERIFSCRPTTITDYRKAILDHVREIDNVWFSDATRKDSDARHGLYRVTIRPQQRLDEGAQAALIDKVHRFFITHRNLCEDIGEISIVREIDCELVAEVEVRRGRAPAEILAEIYHRCAMDLARGVCIYSFEEGMREVETLEKLFRGPYTRHGSFKSQELDGAQNEVVPITDFADKRDEMIARFCTIINDIKGVDYIKRLDVRINVEQAQKDASLGDEAATPSLRLNVPEAEEHIHVKLTTMERLLDVSPRELLTEVDERDFRYRSLRYTEHDVARVYAPPQGIFRELKQYYSVQNHFPLAYGISAYGVPETAPPQSKAKAKQLSAYLLLFEQIMANFTANLDALRTLFSTEYEQKRSYFYQILSKETIHNLDEVYPAAPEQVIGNLLLDYDHFHERKGRLLDYLLALHGEKFSQNSLRHFNYYHTAHELEEVIVKNKIAFLESIVEIDRDRARGIDYLKPVWNTTNVTGLQHRLSLLLGFEQYACRSLAMALLKQGLTLVDRTTYKRLHEGTLALKFIDLEAGSTHSQVPFVTVPLREAGGSAGFTGIRDDITDVVALNNNIISEALLRDGINIGRYRIGSLTEGEGYQIVFKPIGEKQWWYLGTYPDKDAGINAVNALRQFLIKLNIDSEGLHVVEHILLNPESELINSSETPAKNEAYDDAFYSFKLSVIFPSWTTRCNDDKFRHLAEETVHLNCPAHIHPQCYWLDFEELCEFEIMFEKWLTLKSRGREAINEINAAAIRLRTFLRAHEDKATDDDASC